MLYSWRQVHTWSQIVPCLDSTYVTLVTRLHFSWADLRGLLPKDVASHSRGHITPLRTYDSPMYIWLGPRGPTGWLVCGTPASIRGECVPGTSAPGLGSMTPGTLFSFKWRGWTPCPLVPWHTDYPCTLELGAGILAAMHREMVSTALSSCLNPFQSCWVLPSAFWRALGTHWCISLHIA